MDENRNGAERLCGSVEKRTRRSRIDEIRRQKPRI